MTALENMAAAARPPGIGDARVPCPHCGGLIHPVAGRCKHCKEDLSTLRQGRPQAAAALPSLNGYAVAPTITAPAAIAAPVAVTAREGSQPILPQRTTGSHPTAQKSSGGLLRSWPMIVIGLAVLAIITAVVIMVLPQDNARNKRLGKPPAPAPERMDSSPIPPKASQLDDPWDQPDKQPSLPPVPDPNPPTQTNPDPLAGTQPDPNDPNDLFGGNVGTNGLAVTLAMNEHACAKMKSCPGVDQTMMSLLCDQFKTMPKPPVPQSCDAAKRCLRAIDDLDCDFATSVNPIGTVQLLKDCSSAMTDC